MRAPFGSFRRSLILAGSLVSILLLLGIYAWQVDYAKWEVGVLRTLQDSGLPGLRPVSITLAIAGAGVPWAGLIAFFALALWVLIGLRAVGLLLMTAVLQDIGAVLKVLVERARPSEGSVEVWRQVQSHSFPSGHVLGATLVFGFLFFALEHCDLRPGVRRALQAACMLWIVLMGVGRMALGAHWPTDVLGGYVVGALLLMPIVAALRSTAPARA